MPVVFANEPNPELVRKALERFAMDVAARQREKRDESRSSVQKDDLEPIGNENGPQNRI